MRQRRRAAATRLVIRFSACTFAEFRHPRCVKGVFSRKWPSQQPLDRCVFVKMANLQTVVGLPQSLIGTIASEIEEAKRRRSNEQKSGG